MPPHTNRLIHESSPYLLQHAHNPVDWYPWGEEALEKARRENKPVLVSIGYAACHWCHVMERESFEDEETAALMNEHFVNIKIDREERPDLDHIYMDAVQAIAGSGGWPLNVFLTPEGKPFFGGTYFPPRRAFNRTSWKEVLAAVSEAFRDRRHEIDAQAENLTEHLLQANRFGFHSGGELGKAQVSETFENLMKQADREWGGFGRAPKFPQTFSILFLLRHHAVTGNSEALQQARLSLDKMLQGGIYDQIGGGFARYSTDTEWLVPHFEKMLYDNALLVAVYSEAFQLTRDPEYRRVIVETMEFVNRELTDASGGFYSALDADSEGEEGKFYVWSRREVEELLGADAELFCAFLDITETGNWVEGHGAAGKNIPRMKKPKPEFAADRKMSVEELDALTRPLIRKLLEAREQRPRPLLDDKVLLGWNALMNIACSKAFAATGEETYRKLALENMQFLLKSFSADRGLQHTWKQGRAKFPAFLDDYAFLISALIHLQEISADATWLQKARELTEFVMDCFSEAESGFFFYTMEGQKDVILRKKEIYDGATPSGNSVMALNLHQLSILFDQPAWRERSEKMLRSLSQVVIRYPTSFGFWACLLQELAWGTDEIAVTGEGARDLLRELLGEYLPHRVIMATEQGEQSFPLLAGKAGGATAQIWLCRNYSCQRPVTGIAGLRALKAN
ncbi:MAG TPA: thioredoxin domain-containing protein [Chitinophagaceae bacterium]|nr:thioredoxin domain-containing protein [Chitinophagaceae bacterium]